MSRDNESNNSLTPSGVDLTTLQRELRDNERKALTVLETIADSVITIDIAGVVQSFNPAAEREFGYTADEVIGQNVRMLMPGDMAVQHDGFIRNYLNTGDSKIIGVGRELTAQRKDRSLFDIELAIGEMEVAGDRMFTGVIRNITERKRAEAELTNSIEELQQSNANLTTLQLTLIDNERKAVTVLETIADSVITIDVRGTVQSFNRAAEHEFGYASDEVIGQNVRILMPRDMAVQHDGFIKNYLDTGDSKIIGVGRELTAQRKDGSLFDIELAIGEMEVAGDRMFTGVIRNITERKRAEAKLTNSIAELQQSNAALTSLQSAFTDNERKTLTVLETIADSVIIIDAGGIVQSFNPAAEKEFGYSADEVIGQNLRMLMLEEVASRHDGFIRNYLNTGESKIIGVGRELIAKRKNGSTFDIELAISEMEVSGDRMFTGVIRNISERKQAEIEAAKLMRNLRQSNEELERFAAIASHDLQEPLRKVQAFGDRLQKRFHDVLDDTGRDYIARMLNSTSRMQTLINDLLSISRVATQAREFVPVDLNDVVKSVLYDLETSIAESGATVSTGELPVIDADPVQMRQLLQNLIGNALKYHKPDVKPEVQVSAHLLAEADEKSDWSSLPQINRRCELSILDNGIGFGAEYADQIFDIFQRLHGRDAYSGTGVGLAICKKIVERHGGTIEGIGEEGKGATFIATLPISQNRGTDRNENEEWISDDTRRRG